MKTLKQFLYEQTILDSKTLYRVAISNPKDTIFKLEKLLTDKTILIQSPGVDVPFRVLVKSIEISRESAKLVITISGTNKFNKLVSYKLPKDSKIEIL